MDLMCWLRNARTVIFFRYMGQTLTSTVGYSY